MKEERQTAERALMYVVLPLWAIAGLGDYFCHRSSRIERTSGTHESLTHALMMSSLGVPAALALLCEINALTIATSAATAILHEAIVIWDVAYANGRRNVTTTEQHFHSFLEVLPLTSLLLLATSRPEHVRALFGGRTERGAFTLRPKSNPLARVSLFATFLGMGAFVGLPYVEEFVRCYTADRTLAPHAKSRQPIE
ncbi:MAG: diguanylate cyclase [Candidatus Eremiobacteraeota bacterium]|nr:diguanylate cyclase [Candidatus Eremiobacteraeota bacterium]